MCKGEKGDLHQVVNLKIEEEKEKENKFST